jgi:preprotein translocase subunit YajC
LNLLLSLLAQTTQATTSGAAPDTFFRQIMPIILMVAVLYFFVFRAKRNQDKARTSQLEKLKPGQRVQSIGGILGVITNVSDKEITVKVDETNNVKIKFTRNAIHRVLDDDKDKEKTETK